MSSFNQTTIYTQIAYHARSILSLDLRLLLLYSRLNHRQLMTKKMKVKRDLFAELLEGTSALAAQRQGKLTLRTHTVKVAPVPEISARELVRVRSRLNLSRAVFAQYLRTNVRTLENWEQERAKPNAQAALPIRMVKKYPDTLQRLAST